MIRRVGNNLRRLLLVLACLSVFVPAAPRPAHAICVPCVDFICPLASHVGGLWPGFIINAAKTLGVFTARLLEHTAWMTGFFAIHIGPQLNAVAHQMTTVIAHQTHAIGRFFDATIQLEVQREFQRLTLQAHKDYHPSYGMCTFGTAVRNLASADARVRAAKSVLDEQSLRRQLGSMGTSASAGARIDRQNRLGQFRDRFCNYHDNNKITNLPGLAAIPGTGLESVCAAAVPNRTLNSDVDFGRTVGLARTIAFDPADPAIDAAEPDIFALSRNLYAHEPLQGLTASLLAGNNNNQKLYMDLRSLAAKRSLAENSFSSVVALKAIGEPGAGAAGTRPYLEALLQELGMGDEEARAYLGERPSYLAQLEVLAQKMYQRESFYVDLYDKPANVERKKVAMQAIGSILNRDIYNSNLRAEAMMSMLLELKLIPAQKAVEDNIGKLKKK